MLAVLLAAEEPRIHIPATDELVWGSLAFLIVFSFLAVAVFPKAKEALQKRSDKIKSDLEEAEGQKAEAERLLEQYRAQLADARGEAQRIIDEARRAADDLRRQLEAKAQEEAQGIVAKARADVAGERDRAIQELRSTIGDLSLQLASRVVERELSNPEAQRQLVQQMIDELGATGGNGHKS